MSKQTPLSHILQQTKKKQPHYAFERTKSKQKQNQVTLHSNWSRVLLFDLAHKQCNGIINPDLRGLLRGFVLKCGLVQMHGAVVFS